MSVTVRTVNDGDDNWPATHWRVEEAHLWVCSVDRLLAEYPPGQWTAVWREDDEAQDGGEKRADPSEVLRDVPNPPRHSSTVSLTVFGPVDALGRIIDSIRANPAVELLR